MLSRREFAACAREIAAIEASAWTIGEASDVFGVTHVFLKATAHLSPVAGGTESPSCSTGVIRWDDEDEENVISPSPPGQAVRGDALIEYFITYSDAYQVPELYFRGTTFAAAGDVARPIHDPAEWNTAYFGSTVDTCGLQIPTSRPIIGAGFCDALGLALFSLHQCDTEELLVMCKRNGVSDLNAIRLVLRMLGPMLRMPFGLLV